MAFDVLRRPSVIVSAWTLVVVTVFVVRGDLRIGGAAPAAGTASGAAPLDARTQQPADAPVVVRKAPSERRRDPAITVRGRVFDALGFLVVGAEIVPLHRPPARSDADGAFEVEVERATPADVLVRAHDKRPVWLRTGDGSPDALVVQLVPAAPWDPPTPPLPPVSPLRGEGTVRAADGSPLAGAFVVAVGGDVWDRTDEFGRYVLPLPTPSATLLAHEPAAGFGSGGLLGRSDPIASARAQGAMPVPDLVALPAIAVRGIVRDGHGDPVAGVPVAVAGELLRRVTETGPGGAFHVGGLAPGVYDVQPFAFRGSIGRSERVTLADRSIDVDLHLQPSDEVRLRVVDERGSPVGGVYVAASVEGMRRGIAQADADGFAAVPVHPVTEFDVRTAQDHAKVAVRRYEPDPATLVVTLP